MSQVTIDDMIEGCRELVAQRSQQLKSQVWETLSASGVDPRSVNGLMSTFTDEFDPFQEKYFREEFSLLVSDHALQITIWHQFFGTNNFFFKQGEKIFTDKGFLLFIS